MSTFVSRLMKAVGIGLIATCLVTACSDVSEHSDTTQKRDQNLAWKCADGQVSKAFVMPLLNPMSYDRLPSELVYAESRPDGTMDDYESVCLNKDQVAALVREGLPKLHADITAQNAKLDKDQVKVDQVIASFDTKSDQVAKLFNVLRVNCEQRYALPSEYYQFTYVVDASPATIDRIFAAYKQRAKLYLGSDWTRVGYGEPPLAGAGATIFGKDATMKGLAERSIDVYGKLWGDAYELYHTDPTYRQLRAGDFPSHTFSQALTDECR